MLDLMHELDWSARRPAGWKRVSERVWEGVSGDTSVCTGVMGAPREEARSLPDIIQAGYKDPGPLPA